MQTGADDLQGRCSALRCCDLEGVRHGVLATAGERSDAIGLRGVIESDFPSHVSRGPNSSNSLLGASSHASARAARAVVAASLSCSRPSSSALSVAVGAHAVGTPMHGARNSGVHGGLLPVQKSTSYNLDVCCEGPTGRRRGFLAEGLRPCLRGGDKG